MDYERLVSRHKDAVYRQMVRVCGNHDDAEDVLVQALLKAHQAAGDLREEAAFRFWVGTIGRRICSRLRRSEALAPILAMPVDDPAISQAHSGNPEREILHGLDAESCVKSALDSLRPALREVYELDLLDLTAEEIAERLGLTVAAVKSRLHRARLKIREAIDEGFGVAC